MSEIEPGTIQDLLAELVACAGVFDVSTNYEADKVSLEKATQAVLDHVQTLRADAQATVEALQRERDELREATKVICGHCCEPMAIPSKAILQSQLSALQGLVRALPVYAADTRITVDGDLDAIDRPALRSAVMELLEYRAKAALTPVEGGKE